MKTLIEIYCTKKAEKTNLEKNFLYVWENMNDMTEESEGHRVLWRRKENNITGVPRLTTVF